MSKKAEREFLEILESKAREQRRVVESGILPSWAGAFGNWMGFNPWRLIVPVSFLLYVLLRVFAGVYFRELVLGIFGGFL